MALYKTILFQGISKNFVNFTSIGLRAYYKTTDHRPTDSFSTDPSTGLQQTHGSTDN